jgi:hypothetical protein
MAALQMQGRSRLHGDVQTGWHQAATLVSKPRTAAEILAWHGLPSSYELTPEEQERAWNEGARVADATWHQQPHQRGAGRIYREVIEASYPHGSRAFKDYQEI